MAQRGVIVITGASSGIGEACAQRLGALGFDVFAAVRSDSAFERVGAAGGGVRPLKLDITDAESIAAAASEVSAAGDGRLAGLVNNAGIAVSAPLEFIPIEELRHQLEVNVVGQVAVTQAMLGMLRTARGRVVNVSSIGGIVAAPMLGAYAASKFALEGISDALRRELRPWGIGVSVVEPGAISTPIWDKGAAVADGLLERAPAATTELYGPVIETMRAGAEQAARDGLPPSAVADVVAHALTSSRPRTRYLVGREAKSRAAMSRLLPDRVFDALIARALRWR
ncbi:MAG: SDR family NAD(P)-dependent oxidoreductase [Solirubrobacteraceae bacterium]|nr:MAG: short-chain dehydrogenase/reductase [Solirubrobacterales bacterium]